MLQLWLRELSMAQIDNCTQYNAANILLQTHVQWFSESATTFVAKYRGFQIAHVNAAGRQLRQREWQKQTAPSQNHTVESVLSGCMRLGGRGGGGIKGRRVLSLCVQVTDAARHHL